MEDKELTERVIACAFKVHQGLGVGFLEKVYENAMLIELQKCGIRVSQQTPIAVTYENQHVGEYFADLLVEDKVICELKAAQMLMPEHEMQLVNYLAATGINTGLLLNFGKSVTVKRKFREFRKPNMSVALSSNPVNPVNPAVSMDDNIEAKLTAARAWLIIDRPFLGALALRLPLIEADPAWCRTTATDAKSLYYNRDYIESLTFEQTKFVLAHEALHCALAHFARREHRHRRRWDIACDLAINPPLVADGLQPAPGAIVMDGFADMAAEEIYPYIQENSEQEPHDQHIYDDEQKPDSLQRGAPPPQDKERDRGAKPRDEQSQRATPDEHEPPRTGTDPQQQGAPQPPPLSATEREALSQQWQQRLAGAAQQAMQAGKFGGSVARLVEHLLTPQLPWRMLLARYLTSMARNDYNFLRPSRREGNAILPGLRSSHVELVVALDTSGSIDSDEMQEFLSEANAIKGQVGARITLHACDEALTPDGPWVFEPWEELRLPESLQGGGGTRFTPVFDWVARLDRQPDLLVYFTDAKGEFPGQEPSYPVLWLVKGKGTVPWGQRIQLN